MIWWCRSEPINFSMPYSRIADLTLTLCNSNSIVLEIKLLLLLLLLLLMKYRS